MIRLTRLNGSELFLNPRMIETMEEVPETHIMLTNGNRYIVLEPVRVVIDRIVAFESRVLHDADRIHRRRRKGGGDDFNPYCPMNLTE